MVISLSFVYELVRQFHVFELTTHLDVRLKASRPASHLGDKLLLWRCLRHRCSLLHEWLWILEDGGVGLRLGLTILNRCILVKILISPDHVLRWNKSLGSELESAGLFLRRSLDSGGRVLVPLSVRWRSGA